MTEANVAVLIDFENVGLDTIQYLLDQLSDVGRVNIKRAYADWSEQRNKRDQLLDLGIEAIHHFRSGSGKTGKNSSDIRLAIDAVDLLHGAPVDTFVIVSSDSDFVPLVSKLRAAGKSVIGSGRRGAASSTLVKSCDRYIYLEDAKAPIEIKRRPRSKMAEVASLVVRAVEASMDEQGKVVGSRLYQTMQRIDPSFSYKALGHRTFTQYLESSKEVSVERPRDAGDVIVQLNQSRERGADDSAGIAPPDNWDRQVNTEWARRQRNNQLSGQAAAAVAAKVLGTTSLKAAGFRTLDKVLDASEFLRANWRRDGNAIVQK